MTRTDSTSRLAQTSASPAVASAGHPVLRFVAVRLALLVPSLFFAVSLSFFLVNLVPSDPVGALLGTLATPAQIAAKTHELGLDQNLWVRYVNYMRGLLHGDLGTSFIDGKSVSSSLFARVPSTLTITMPALVIAFFAGVNLGVWQSASAKPVRIRAIVTVLQSIPSFVFGVLGLIVLVVGINVLPAPTGQLDVFLTPPPAITGSAFVDSLLAGNMEDLGNASLHLVLPVLSLALVLIVPFARITASTMTDNLRSEFTTFSTGNGLPKRYLLANARKVSRSAISVTTGIVAAETIGGAVIVERLFAWDGLGQWSLTAILNKDIPEIEAFVLVSTITTIVVYLIADVVGTVLDPRLK